VIQARGLALLILAAASCGGDRTARPTPAAPSDLPHLKTGLQWLDLLGFAYSDDPNEPTCAPPFVPRDGTQVTTRVVLERDQEEWVAREADSGSDSLLLRFHDAGRSVLGRRVAGTLRGSAVNVPRFAFELLRDVRVTIAGGLAGSATIEGTVPSLDSFVLGKASGEIRFGDRAGTAWSTCSTIQWSLQPAGGIATTAP